ncbi:MAG: polyprenyl diphosphate synthase [bacterium]
MILIDSELENLIKLIDKTKLPNHIAFIMDGNRRWAKIRNLPSYVGHQKGFSVFKNIIDLSKYLGIKELSFFAFSKENWARNQQEVEFIFNLMKYLIKRELSRLEEDKVFVKFIGDKSNISNDTIELFELMENKTSKDYVLKVNVMVNYSGKYDIEQAIKRIINNKIDSKDINSELIKSYLLVGEPDLLIRTGNEYRISNFLLYQLAYTELYFSPKLWPDFTLSDYIQAILDYQKRERRLGK